MNKKEIHARIKTIDNGNEVAKFIFIEELPGIGTAVRGTDYHYGKPMKCDLVPYQKTRDGSIVNNYDFYILPVYNADNHYVGRSCLCVNHVMTKTINAKIYQTMIDMARNYGDADSYLIDAVKSPVWKKEDVSSEGKEEWLRNIYVAANRTIRDVIKETGLSQAKFGEYFGIPKRSIENWCNGYTTILPYLLIMMQEILGLIDRG